MTAVRLGLIGAGRWGRRYIATLGGMPGVELVRLASANPESPHLVSAACTISPDWRDVVQDPTLDGLILACPAAFHAEIAAAAMDAALPVLIEKPMALSVAEAQCLSVRAQQTSQLALVGHTHLFSSAFRALKREALALGSLLEIRSRGGNWGPCRPDTPMLWDWAPHDLSMCLDLVGADPISVDARLIGTDVLPDGYGEAVEIQLTFPGGVGATIRVSNIDRSKSRRFEARYERGSLVYDDLAPDKLRAYRHDLSEGRAVPCDASMPLYNQIIEFCGAIRSGLGVHPSLDLGLRVVQVLDRCQQRLGHRRNVKNGAS